MAPSGPNDDASREDPLFVRQSRAHGKSQCPLPCPIQEGSDGPSVRTRPSTHRVETPRTQHSVTPCINARSAWRRGSNNQSG